MVLCAEEERVASEDVQTDEVIEPDHTRLLTNQMVPSGGEEHVTLSCKYTK